MLEVDADRRITAEQALAHQYLAQYADPTDEPTSAPYDQTFEDLDLPVDQLKGDMIYLNFHEFFCTRRKLKEIIFDKDLFLI